MCCGGGQTRAHPFDRSWADESGEELEVFRRNWRPSARAPVPSVAIGLVDDRTLVGLDVESGRRWRYSFPFEGRPVLSGSVLVGAGDGYLFALDPTDGRRRWWRPAVGVLRGAGDDGETTVASLEGLTGRRSLVLAIDRRGSVVRQIFDDARIGSPAVFDQFAFLPYEGRQVLVFDLVAGTETARVVSSRPTTRAFIAAGKLYFGHDDAVAFDDAIVDARDGGGTRVAPPARGFPGRPRWLFPGDEAPPMTTIRHDSVRLLYAPGQPRATLLYHRLALGLDDRGRVRWVRTADAPHVGGVAYAREVVVCDAAGRIQWLDAARGNVVARADLGLSVRACLVQAETRVARKPEPKPSLVDQLTLALRFSDPLHLPIQLELIDDLDAIDGDAATAALVELAALVPRTAAQETLREAITERLATRRTGLGVLREGLRQLSPWRPSALPVAAMATALRRAGDARAGDALVAALHHPHLTSETRLAVAEAIAAVATPEHALALSAFAARHACIRPEEGPAWRRTRARVFATLHRLAAEGPAERARRACPPARAPTAATRSQRGVTSAR